MTAVLEYIAAKVLELGVNAGADAAPAPDS